MICKLKRVCVLLGLSIILIFVNKSFNDSKTSLIDLNENQNVELFKNALDNTNSHLIWFVQVKFSSLNSKLTN